jgi:hypothetical protein
VAAAMMRFQAPEYCVWKLAMATWIIHSSLCCIMVRGHKKAFQFARKKNTASAARIGLLKGSTTFQ